MNQEPEMQMMTEEWTNKLVGKKFVANSTGEDNTFTRDELPDGNHRVIAPGQMVTKDFKPNRLNVHVDKDGKCTHINFQ